MAFINKDDIKKVLKAFESTYKRRKKEYEEENVKIEDVINLTESFSEKSVPTAAIVVIAIMKVMPPREFMALMKTVKSMAEEKLLQL